MSNLHKKYEALLKENGFQSDAEQRAAIISLQRLLDDLKTSKPFLPFLKPKLVRGVYMHGGVGRGKSMLMNLFFSALPKGAKNRRVHFHEFMIETHDWLHQNRGKDMEDLLPAYAHYVAKNTKVLCFDEFHVVDVADAMILARLFTQLFQHGVVVVSTSNWAPDNLYEGGLQRDLFLPFIDLLKQRMQIVHLDNEIDYRQISDPDQDVYFFFPLNNETSNKVEKIFDELSTGIAPMLKKIKVKGRSIDVMQVKDIARFSFTDLCEQPLGAEDYIAIAKKYDTIFVEKIPALDDDKRNEAKRFILLIDCLYEAHCRLIFSSENDIYNLYSGEDHNYEFDRTISRLMEMQSVAYHEKRLEIKGRTV